MQITEKQLQHLVKFLTHDANYKVAILDDDEEYEHNYNTTIELLDNAKQLIDLYYDGKLTYAKAMEIAIKYRYDDDCINEGVAEMWWGYCNENKMLDFYFTDKTAHDYADSFVY
jgi:hypothetical protein